MRWGFKMLLAFCVTTSFLFYSFINSFLGTLDTRNKVPKGLLLTPNVDAEDFSTERKLKSNSMTVVYVKVHKSGSSTIRDILIAHSKKHLQYSKYTMFPKPFIGGYPGHFRRKFATIISANHTIVQPDHPADVIWDHYRFDEKEIRKAMNPNARYVTILRNPERQFESAFYYFYARFTHKAPKNSIKTACWEYPYLYVTGGRRVDLSEYLSIANTSLNESAPWFFRSRNSQSYELGLDPLNMKREYALQEAKKLEEIFDLVLIFDHLPESIILLKDLFDMEWEDAIPTRPPHAGQYLAHSYTNREKEILRKLTFQDQILYDYFNATFWRKVDAYGRMKMADDVAYLEMLIRRKYGEGVRKKRNVRDTSVRPIVPQREKRDSHSEAINLIRLLDESNAGRHRPGEEKTYEIARYMAENYGWCPTTG